MLAAGDFSLKNRVLFGPPPSGYGPGGAAPIGVQGQRPWSGLGGKAPRVFLEKQGPQNVREPIRKAIHKTLSTLFKPFFVVVKTELFQEYLEKLSSFIIPNDRHFLGCNLYWSLLRFSFLFFSFFFSSL